MAIENGAKNVFRRYGKAAVEGISKAWKSVTTTVSETVGGVFGSADGRVAQTVKKGIPAVLDHGASLAKRFIPQGRKGKIMMIGFGLGTAAAIHGHLKQKHVNEAKAKVEEAQGLFKAGNEALEQRNPDLAIQKYLATKQIIEDAGDLEFNLGVAYYVKGEATGDKALIQKAIEQWNKNAKAITEAGYGDTMAFNLGVANLMVGDIAKAKDQFAQLSNSPDQDFQAQGRENLSQLNQIDAAVARGHEGHFATDGGWEVTIDRSQGKPQVNFVAVPF